MSVPVQGKAPQRESPSGAGPLFLDSGRFAAENRRRISGPGLRTFAAIADLWNLTEGERLLVLGLPSRSTYYGWIKAAREHRAITLPVDTLLRISAVLGILKALRILFTSDAEGKDWLRRPHGATVFGGRPPLDLVTSGTQDGLITVRRFLDAARGGIYMEPNAADLDFHPATDADIVFV
jgi:uncharacterized protein (DUF2384 family)